MPRPWRYSAHDAGYVRRLCTELNVSPLTAQVLLARGFLPDNGAASFLNARLTDLHDPDLLPGVAEATERIVSAVKAGRRVTIYGDYDVDGVTSTSMLWHCLQLLNAKVDYYIPCRMEEGYGLNCEAIRQLHAEDPQRLVVSVDCGICSTAEAALARELGLELIITDHHMMDAELPEAAVLVHPRLPGTSYPFGDLCGAGVALKVAWSICRKLGDGKHASPRMREFLLTAVGLAAIGTVADVVPLLGENRVIVRYGLSGLKERSSLGLKALLKVAGFEEKPSIESEDVAFGIAPRLNAAGRLGQARLAVELLTTEASERAGALADYVDQLNKQRRTVEQRIFKEAKELVAEHEEWLDQPALVLAHHDWHPGVIGIVASRVVEHFQKPAILIALNTQTGIGAGSGRSFGGHDMHAALTDSRAHLKSCGGHKAAIGLKVEAARIDAFREDFVKALAERHTVTDKDRELVVDAEVRLADVTRKAVLELDKLGPFGQSNPKPVFVAARIELAEPPRKMGEGERHLSLRVKQTGAVMRAVAFGRGEWADEIAAVNGPISISFAPGINRYRGNETVELQLIDWRPANAAP
jgi:single-stranded-DNA-specific exonuclease